jgi:transcription initiation factor TFIID subunit 1
VPDYYNLVKNPIDLQTIRKRVNEKFYKNRLMFLEDIQLLIDNSALYNGRNHAITISGETLYEFCMQRFNEKSEKFERLEKAINPLLDDNSLIAFNYLLDQIYEQHIIKVENSFSFLKPVSRIKYKDYYDIIQNPIDLETIKYVRFLK